MATYLEINQSYGVVYSNHIVCEADAKYDVEYLKKKKVRKSLAPSPNMPPALYEDDFIIAPKNGICRLKIMIENEIKVLEKFKDYPQINSKPRIRSCCEQGISLAVDFEADKIIIYIREYLKCNQVRIGYRMGIKYLFYKLKIWGWIKNLQKIGKGRIWLRCLKSFVM